MRKSQVSGDRWAPPLFLMMLIFVLSGQPSAALPTFGWADYVVKKGAHMVGFGLLSLAYWRALGWAAPSMVLAWLLTVLYALTDETHQAFVPGRHPSLIDVLVFDGGGAAIALWLRRVLVARPSEPSSDVSSEPRQER